MRKADFFNIRGRLMSFERPLVMGILNITPDSFSDGGCFNMPDAALRQVEKMLSEGADMIDIGAMSTRPFADDVTEKEEIQRLSSIIPLLVKHFPNLILSVDTYRSEVAKAAVNEGVAIVNDVTGGQADEAMFRTVADLHVPCIMMHTKGMPKDMQIKPEYEDVTKEVIRFFAEQIEKACQAGINDIIIDPGFGFGKTLDHNYELLSGLDCLQILNRPVLVGVSRKSMIQKLLNTEPLESINGTTAINTVALMKGADILRVHDVKEAVQAVEIVNKIKMFNPKI